MSPQIERMAEAIRKAYAPHHSTPLIPWSELPEYRREKWREMAAAALSSALPMEGTDLLPDPLFKADQAFLDTQAAGSTVAVSVRAAIAAYVSAAAEVLEELAIGSGGPVQYLATLPDDHPDLRGGQVLVRSFDGGETWEVCTRPDTYSTWSVGVTAEDTW